MSNEDRNNVAEAIRIISIIVFIGALILCLVAAWLSTLLYFWIALGGALSGLLLLGFAEVIKLLHESLQTQKEMLTELKSRPQQEAPVSRKTIVQDIEDSLPDL